MHHLRHLILLRGMSLLRQNASLGYLTLVSAFSRDARLLRMSTGRHSTVVTGWWSAVPKTRLRSTINTINGSRPSGSQPTADNVSSVDIRPSFLFARSGFRSTVDHRCSQAPTSDVLYSQLVKT